MCSISQGMHADANNTFPCFSRIIKFTPDASIRLLLTEYLLILGYDATISRALAIRWVFRAMWQLYYELKFWPSDNKNASRQYLLKSVFWRQCSRKVSKMGTHHNPVFRVNDVDRALGSLVITVKHQVSSHSINEVHFNKTCNNQSCFNGKEQLQQGNCDAPWWVSLSICHRVKSVLSPVELCCLLLAVMCKH